MPLDLLPHSLGLADAALVTLLPGFEGLVVPSKLLGYMARAVPTLYVGPDSDVAQFIERSRGGACVAAGDVEAFARVVEQWVAHPQELRAAGEAAAAYYEAELSRQRGLAAYRDAVCRGGRRTCHPGRAMSGRIVVTGAGGFIGRALVAHLQQAGREVVPVTRATPEPWPEVLRGADAVVHLAARAHVVHDTATDPMSEFRGANVAGTEQLLSAAIGCSVRRFVFVSSIGVLGNDSGQRAFTAADPPNPIEPYARSKWEAEQRVMALTAGTATQPVIVRPPLVYGPGVKGNFLRLLKLVDSGVPLPFAGLTAQRSFIGIDNLCGLLAVCVDHPAAAGRTLLAADGEDVTLPALLKSIGRGLGRPVRLFRAPWGLVESLARLAGRGADLARLTGSLRVDDSVTRTTLGWQPGVPFEAGIRAMAEWYREAAAS